MQLQSKLVKHRDLTVNSVWWRLKSLEYSVPVLGLIFLRYADHRFAIAEKQLAGKGTGRRTIGKEDYQAKGVMFLPPQARDPEYHDRLRALVEQLSLRFDEFRDTAVLPAAASYTGKARAARTFR